MKLIAWALFTVAGILMFTPCHAQDADKSESMDSYSLEDKWDQSVEEIERAWDQSVGKIDKPESLKGRKKDSAAGLENNKNLIFQNKIDENMLENIPRVEPSSLAPYTGLIIDARGTDIKPCLVFQINGASKGRLYGRLKPVPDLLRKKGRCGWAGSVKEALTCQRTGLNPIQLKATITVETGLKPVSILIDDERLDRNLRSKIDIFLQKNAVVIVF